MSQGATSRPAESDATSALLRPRASPSSGSGGSGGDSAALEAAIEVCLLDAWEEQIEDQIVGQLLRGASPALRRQAAAQRAELRARMEALRREAARSRAEARRLREYSDLLRADVSGYTDAAREAYERELQRRSRELFGDH
ncbi:hypothetical protein ACP4OV_019209 [Aristida adscensionis]